MDKPATRVLLRNGMFENEGSFLTLRDSKGRIHVHLEGKDRSKQRERCIRKAGGKCAVCKRVFPMHIALAKMEMHHPGRCDCIDRECPTHVETRCPQFEANCHRHFWTEFKRKAPELPATPINAEDLA
jgi:hypothetical protein